MQENNKNNGFLKKFYEKSGANPDKFEQFKEKVVSDEDFRKKFYERSGANADMYDKFSQKVDELYSMQQPEEVLPPESIFEGTDYSSIDEVQSRLQSIQSELAPKESILGALGFTGLGSMEQYAPEESERLKEEKESLEGLLEMYEERVQNSKGLNNPENFDSPEDYIDVLSGVQKEYGDVVGTEKEKIKELKEGSEAYDDNSWLGYLRVVLRGITSLSPSGMAQDLPKVVMEEVSKPQQMMKQSESIKLNIYGAALMDSYKNTEKELKESYGEDNYLAFQKILSFANQTQQQVLNPETGELDIPAELYKQLPSGFNINKVIRLATDPRLNKMQKIRDKAKETSQKLQGLDEKYPLVKAVEDIAKEDAKKVDDLYRESNWLGKSYLTVSTVLLDTPKSVTEDIIEMGVSLYGLYNPDVGKAYFTGKGMERVPDIWDFTTSKQKRPVRERTVPYKGYIVGVDDSGKFQALYDEEGYAVDVPNQEFIKSFEESGRGENAEKSINWGSTVYNGLRTARDVAITMAYTRLTGGVGAATKLSGANAIVPSIMFQYQNDFLEEGVQAGLDFRTAYGVATLRGLKSGLINRINPLEAGTVTNYLNRGVSRANVEAIKGTVSAASKNKNALFTWLSQMGSEQVEELMDEFTDVQLLNLVDANMEGVNHDAHFDPIEVGLLTAFATMGPATIGTLANYNSIESDDFYKESVFKSVDNFEKYQKVVEDLRAKEQISSEDADNQLNRIKRIKDNYEEYLKDDSPLTEGQKMDLVNAADREFILESKLAKLPNTDSDSSKESEAKLQQAKRDKETIIFAKESGDLKELEQHHKENGTYDGFYGESEVEQESDAQEDLNEIKDSESSTIKAQKQSELKALEEQSTSNQSEIDAKKADIKEDKFNIEFSQAIDQLNNFFTNTLGLSIKFDGSGRRKLDNGKEVVTYEVPIYQNGKVIGNTGFKIVNGKVEISFTEINEELQGKGITSILYQDINNALQQLGYGVLHSDTTFLEDSRKQETFLILDGKELSLDETSDFLLSLEDPIEDLEKLKEEGRVQEIKKIKPGEKLWQSLERKGLAEKLENGQYRFINAKYDAELDKQEATATEEDDVQPTEETEEQPRTFVRRDIGDGESVILEEKEGSLTPINESQVPEGAEIVDESELDTETEEYTQETPTKTESAEDSGDIDLGDLGVLGGIVPQKGETKPSKKVTDEDIDKVTKENEPETNKEVKSKLRTKVQTGGVGSMRTEDISVDAARFQFKKVEDKKKGINKTLSGVPWNPENAGVITVWKDPSDGNTYVVNGHHRLALAQEQGVDNINVFYLDAENASEARVKGAIQNIAEEKGTSIDAAKVIREEGFTLDDLNEAGLSLSATQAKEGLALSKLEKNVFQAVVAGDLKKNVGVIIGEEVDNPNLQLELFKAVQGKNYTQGQIRVMAQDISNMKTEKKTSVNLFGETETEQADFENRSKFISNVRGLISRAKNLLGKTSSSKEFLEQYGNEIDAERSKGASEDAAQALAFFDAYRNSFPEISNILNKGYERVKNGEKRSKVESETANELIENLEGIIQKYSEGGSSRSVSSGSDQQSDGRVEEQTDSDVDTESDSAQDGLAKSRVGYELGRSVNPNKEDSAMQEGLFTQEQFNTRDRNAEGEKVTDKTSLPKTRIGRIINAILPTAKAAGFNIILHDSPDSMMNAIAQANGGRLDSVGGFVLGKDIHVYTGEGVKDNTPLHELFHPVIAQIIRDNPEVFQQLVDSIQRSRSKSALDARVFMQQYVKEGNAVALQEMVVEALASEALVSLEEAMAEYANQNRSGFKRILNKLLELLGIRKPQREVLLKELIQEGSDYVSLGRALGRALGTNQVIKGFGPFSDGSNVSFDPNSRDIRFSRQGQPTREEVTINNLQQTPKAKDKLLSLFDTLPYESERIVKAFGKQNDLAFTQQQVDLILDIAEARRREIKERNKKQKQKETEKQQPMEGISFKDDLDSDIKDALDKTGRKEKDLTRYVRRLLRSRLIPKVLKKRLLGDPDELTKRSLELEQIEQLANAYLADANTYEDYVAKLEELRKPYDQEIVNEETLWGLTALHRLSVKFTQLNTSEGIDQAAEIHKIVSDHLSRSGANLGAASPQMLPDSQVEFVAVGEIIRIHKQLKKETADPLNEGEKIIPQERIEQIRQEVQQEYEDIIEGLREDLANVRAKRASQAPEVKATPKQKVRVRKAKGKLRKKANKYLKEGMALLKEGRNQEVRFSKQGITPENANIDNLSEVSQRDTTALIKIALSTLYSAAGNITEARSLFTQLLKESGERSRIYTLFGRKDVFDVIANSDAFQELSKDTLREIAVENFKAAIDTHSGVLKNRDVVDKAVEEITNAVNAKKNARLTYTDKLPENISEGAQKLLDEAKKRAEKIVENYRTDLLDKGQAEVELQRVQDELQVALDDAGEPIIAPDYNLATYTKPQNGDMISVGGKMFMFNGSNWMNTQTDRGATLKQREKIMDQFNSSFISPSKINEVRKGIVEGTISDSDLMLAWKSFKSRISVLPDAKQREQLNQFEEVIYNTFGLDITGNVETRVRVRNNAELANTTLNEIIDQFYLEAKGTDLPKVLMERLGMDEAQANKLADDIKKVISEQARPKVKKIIEKFVKSRESVSSALDLALSGMLTMEDFKLAFGKEYDFSILDKKKVEEFKQLLNAYQTAELGVDEKKAAGDLQQFLIDNKNEHWIVKVKDLVVSLIYAAYLNGVKPFFTAAIGGGIIMFKEMPMGLLKTVINLQPRIFLEAIKYGFKGLMTKGVREGVHIFKTGNSSRIYMNDPMNTHRKNLAQKALVDNYNKFLSETKPRFSKEFPARAAALLFWSIPSLLYRMGSLVIVGDALVRSFGTDYNMAMKYYFDVISEGRQPTKDLLVAIQDKLGYDPTVDKERIDSIIKSELKNKEFNGPNAAADKKKYIETRTDEIIMESKRIAPIVAREMKEMDFGEGIKGKLRAKLYETRRSAELRSEFQDDGLASRASYLSQVYALMQTPEGILGEWANTVTSFLNQGSNRKNTTGLQLILSGLAQFLVAVHFPFVLKVGVNAANKALSYGGYNVMIKPLVHQIYKRLNVKTDNKEDLKRFNADYILISESVRADDVIYRERDAQERWNYMMESAVGVITTAILTTIMFDFEEDDDGEWVMKLSKDSPLRTTGTGTGSYTKDKSLDDGFEAKAAQIKWDGKYRTIFNWDRHPVGAVLAPLGYAHDKIYFNDGVKLGGMALPKMLGSAIFSGMANTLFSNVIEDTQNLVEKVSTVLSTFDTTQKDGRQKVKQASYQELLLAGTITEPAGSVLTGGAFTKWLNDMYAGMEGEALYQGESIHTKEFSRRANLMDMFGVDHGIEKRRHNQFGSPMIPEIGVFTDIGVADYAMFGESTKQPTDLEKAIKSNPKLKYAGYYAPKVLSGVTAKDERLPMDIVNNITHNQSVIWADMFTRDKNRVKKAYESIDESDTSFEKTEVHDVQESFMTSLRNHAISEAKAKAVLDALDKAGHDYGGLSKFTTETESIAGISLGLYPMKRLNFQYVKQYMLKKGIAFNRDGELVEN